MQKSGERYSRFSQSYSWTRDQHGIDYQNHLLAGSANDSPAWVGLDLRGPYRPSEYEIGIALCDVLERNRPRRAADVGIDVFRARDVQP